jgi:hypothetical protein
MSQMIPLHIADQAVAACEAEIAKLREENARLKAEMKSATDSHRLNSSMWRDHVARLQAEVETLQNRCDFLEGRGHA